MLALLSDSYLHSDSSPGTAEDSDWGDKAPTGVQYVVAVVQGNWTAIWYAGQKAWFYNPLGSGATASLSVRPKVTPKSSIQSVAVYGGAYPPSSAYPAVIPCQIFDQLYTISTATIYNNCRNNAERLLLRLDLELQCSR